MANLRALKKIVQVYLVAVFSLQIIPAKANDIEVNMFPALGKPIYAVFEFSATVPDPLQVAVASEQEYVNSGFERPEFLDQTFVRKLSANRFLVTSETPIDESNFALVLDVTYTGSRRFYPYEVSVGEGQAVVSLGQVRNDRAALATVLPIEPQTPQQTLPVPQENLIEVRAEPQPGQRIIVSTEPTQPQQPVRTEPAEMNMQPPLPQPPTITPPANPDTLPFYMMGIVLTVLVLLAILAMGMFFHMSNRRDDDKHRSKSEDESMSNQLIKLLPTLLGVKEEMAMAGANENPIQNYGVQRRRAPAQDVASYSAGELEPFASPAPEQMASSAAVKPRRPANRAQRTAPEATPAVEATRSSAPGPLVPRQDRAPKSSQSQALKESPAETRDRPRRPTSVTESVQASRQTAPPKQATTKQATTKQNASEAPVVSKSEKLQLAVVYMNMGDEVMARMLLDELIREGTEAERNEAQQLLTKLDSSAPQASIIADDNKGA